MRWKSVLGLGALLPFSTGCNLAFYAGHNLVNEPVTRLDEHKLSGRLRGESRAVWRGVCQQFPARSFTPEFADGFTDGYADHLENGGVPAPPAVPPLRYRRADYLTPTGHALIRDYMVGYQYGAEVAVSVGSRQFLTVPVGVPEQHAEVPVNVTQTAAQYAAPPAASLDVPGTVKPRLGVPDAPAPGSLPTPRPLGVVPESPKPGLPKVEIPLVPSPDPDVKPVAADEVVPDAVPDVPLPPVGGVAPEHRPPAAQPPAPAPPRSP